VPRGRASTLAKAGLGNNPDANASINHSPSEFGPGVDNRAQTPASGLADPGVGLRNHLQRYGRRVLTYADLRSLHPTRDKREPEREIELHLTGNMERYIWSINGQTFAQARPLELTYGERVRIVLINDTMMTHPIHLHGMWSELETGDPDYIPRKHTVLVQPGSKISYLVTADAPGNWAYHCHLMFHMLGMMRQVSVTQPAPAATEEHHHHAH
jgi:FtsP/CotA-like multicopper oxidase with cupredoxin domain